MFSAPGFARGSAWAQRVLADGHPAPEPVSAARVTPGDDVIGPRPGNVAGEPHRLSLVLLVAVVLIGAQIAVRGWVAGRGYFYWDDLILVGRAGRYPLWSPDLLLYDHDGHFMPLAFATAWVVTKIAPLQWGGAVVTMLVLQLAASVAVLRMLLVLVPLRAGRARWALLIPFAGYLFCPLTLPAFAWWAASLNALPLQFALAWVVADAVLLVRTGRGRYAVSGVLVLIVGLLFFEKAVAVPFVAFAVAVLDRYVRRPESSGRAAVRAVAGAGARLWLGSAAVLAGWTAAYLTVANHTGLDTSLAGVRRLLHSATSLGIVPTLLGGPWVWERWLPSTPWATPPGWAVVLAWLMVALVVLLSVWMRRRVLPVWILVAGYVLAVQLPIVLIRGGPNTAAELMQSLRYLADVAVVLAAGCALLLAAPVRETGGTRSGAGASRRPGPGFGRPPENSRSWARGSVIALTVAFVASSLYTTVSFTRSWQISPTRTYLTNAEAAFADWDGSPLLEQEVPWDVLTPMAHPQNLAARVLGPIAPAGAFAVATPRLRMLTDEGKLVDASVWWNRRILAGPEPGCGYRVDGAQPVALWLDGPMLEHGWTAQINYFADRDGRITVALEHGAPAVAPVRAGVHTVFVHVVGSGELLRIGSRTPGLDVCVGVGPVGVAAFGP